MELIARHRFRAYHVGNFLPPPFGAHVQYLQRNFLPQCSWQSRGDRTPFSTASVGRS